MDTLQAGQPTISSRFRRPGFLGFLLLLTVSSTLLILPTVEGQSTSTNPILFSQLDKINKLELFATWPKEKPELVLALTGQMVGYIQKCGCSSPQKGGLERRYNFLDWLRTGKGWEVLPLDLGDLSDADRSKLQKQSLLKYQVGMESLQAMGYRAIAVGQDEFRFPLIDALATFSLQDAKAFPKVHGANLLRRNDDFPSEDGSMILSSDVYPGKSMKVGIVGLVGRGLITEINKIDSKIGFAEKSDEVVKSSLEEIQKRVKEVPTINVLLYQGDLEDARIAAKFFPQFQIIVCRSAESEPPAQPTMVGDTMILRVGHKGQNVGVVGVFKEKGKLTLHYEKVIIGEEYETPADREKDNPVLTKFDWYAKEVRDRKFLPQFPKSPHPMQAAFPKEKIEFVGTAACLGCHGQENLSWEKTKHAKGYAALENVARHPSMRNFDGECIVCHTVGFNYTSGFDGTKATDHLKDVGCENCHGPGSLHTKNPIAKAYYAYLSPWKIQPKDKLPDAALLQKLLEAKNPEERMKLIAPAQEKTLLRVDDICQKCHDPDNDPHFRFEKYWPQIAHTGLKNMK